MTTKVFLRCLAVLAFLVLPLFSSSYGDDPRDGAVTVAMAVQQAKMALANKARAGDDLFKAKSQSRKCSCDGPENCTCPAGLCSCPECSTAWNLKAFESATKQNLPVVVFVGQKSYKAAGFLSYESADYADAPKPGAILLSKDGDNLIVVKKFSGRPTEQQIAEAMKPTEQTPPVWTPPVDPVFFVPAKPVFFGGAPVVGAGRGGC